MTDYIRKLEAWASATAETVEAIAAELTVEGDGGTV